MALINEAKKEIHAKIVYLGPKGAGKATALGAIYNSLGPERRSELKTLAAGEHRMLFFDFSYPLPRRSDGYTLRFHIYTLTAGNTAPPPWKMLLKGADGIVFLADSAAGKKFSNLESCALMLDALVHYGVKPADIAFSLQCNKRDLDGAVPLADIKADIFPELDEEPTAVSAVSGSGLLDGLNRIVAKVLHNLGAGDIADAVGGSERTSADPSADAALTAAPSPASCSGDEPSLTVEPVGAPHALDSRTIVIPLRLTGGVCGKGITFNVTISVSR